MANAGVSAIKIIDNDNDVVSVTNNKLDVNATLVAGATIDIGDVDMFLDGGTALVGGNGTATSGTLRVTIASDTTGVLSVDDNGGSITVDGTVTAELSSTDNDVLDLIQANTSGTNTSTAATRTATLDCVTALEIMDDWDESDRAKVNLIASQAGITGNAGAVAANTPRVTLASDDPAVAHLSEIEGAVETIESAVTFGTFVSYPDFEAATTATAISDSTNGVNASITDAKEIIIQTDDENTGYIMVGSTGNTLAGSVGSRKGIKMNGGETLVLNYSTFANIFIDASGSSQYVNVAYFK